MAHLQSPARRLGVRNVLASPASLLPSPLDKKYGLSGACSPMAVGEGTLKFDDILVSDSDSAESSQDALEAFSQLEANAEVKSGSQLELFVPVGKMAVAGDDQAKLVSKAALAAGANMQQHRIPAVWNDGELISRASSAATGAVEPSLAPAPSEAASADDEAGQQATSALKAAAPATAAAAGVLETAEDVKPRLAGAKRPFEVTREPSFSFPVLSAPATQALAGPASRAPAMPTAAAFASRGTSVAPAHAAVAVGKRGKMQYDRMRELEGQVQQIKAAGDTLVMAVRRADAQYSAALSENQQLWALVAHLTACLRAGQAAATTSTGAGASEPATATAAPSTGGTPDLLLGSLFSPDAADLAAACGMFVSPLKLGAAAPAANKPRRLFEGEAGTACGAQPSQGKAAEPAGSYIVEIPAAAMLQTASMTAAY